MAKLKLGLSRRNPEDLVALAKHVHPKIVPTPPTLPPVPDVEDEAAALLLASDECEPANTAAANALTAYEALLVVRDEKADALRLAHNVMASALEAKSKGEPGPLAITGYALAGTSVPATTPPAKLLNLVVTAGDNDGSLDAACDPDPLANTVEWQVTTVDPVVGPYVSKDPTTLSSTTITGLTSGNRVWIRARGVGSKGPGPFSDPVSKIVP